jgi:hypothetical protein
MSLKEIAITATIVVVGVVIGIVIYAVSGLKKKVEG